jgi:hypothetical protein
MMGPDVELSPATLLREELAGVHRAALSVWRFQREGGDNLLKARIIA